ncbi:HET-domain-containing protein [Paraphaeosphaeria sporulosa]|uniref:HET-domain-containing protein n=1 Tax=Paraphaeosphaeria sporulosa TaxID=1460663 RepID=A0A177CHV6_9PLEO|nr:HET-domain-containing protein [Paraphaeosphaeria sporulosa]OAG06439.1 HET-domain-containing protein [Paraphaeosphaeria sporulosa]
MSLCDLCRNIPWENLPEVPEHLPMNSTGHKYIQPVMHWPAKDRGHPHHQSLDALRNSARSCALCQLIVSSAENVEQQLIELKPKWEAKEMMEYGWPTYKLFIVKRREGGDGCWVMSFVDGDEEWTKRRKERGDEEAWIIAALGLCVRDGNPLQEVIQGRPVENDARSQVVFGRCRRWLQDCSNHPTCNPAETLLPSRVIDVGEFGSPRVHLWEPPEDTVGQYVSLSYCWGSPMSFTTTRATMESRKAGIEIADMPPTYQDVVRLTRELGLRYVWVDSLCILQDEHADWERESARMLSIYSNAYLTVAAHRAKDISEGFLHSRPKRSHVELGYTRSGIHGKVLAFNLPLREELIKTDYVNLPNEPLSERAWGLQERVLSHRVMIYGSDQIFFECNEGFRGEDGLNLDFRHACAHKSLDGTDLEEVKPWYKDLSPNKRPKRDTLRGWYDLLWEYGPKKLTRASDKLPAISGIASLYAEKIEEEYLAGLWRDQLIEGLTWQSLRWRRASEYRAPSWSWASGDGIPGSGQIADYTELAEILDAKVVLKDTNPFGEVADGWIKLRAPCEQLYLIMDDWDPEVKGYKYNKNVKVRTGNGNPKGGFSRFDFDFTAEDAPQEAKKIVKSLEGVEIYALFILKSHGWNSNASEDAGYHALIVKRVEGTENYQRLGFLLADKDMIGKEPGKEDMGSFRTITLV